MPTLSVNGTNLYYREAGSGEPLLLIHGTGFTADVWDKVLDILAQDYRTIAYDRRAFQRSQGSPPPTVGYGRQQGEDIAALLQALGATPANLVGWSAGGLFALHATLIHPERIKHLVLYEPPLYAVRYMDFPIFKSFITINALNALGKKQAAAAAFVRMVLAYQDGRNSFENLSPELRAQVAANADAILAEFSAGTGSELSPSLLSTQVRMPVTLLAGQQSPSSLTKPAENLARILHNAPVVWLPESNHLAQIDQPDLFVKAVRGALARR